MENDIDEIITISDSLSLKLYSFSSPDTSKWFSCCFGLVFSSLTLNISSKLIFKVSSA